MKNPHTLKFGVRSHVTSARRPSNWRSTQSLPDYFKEHNIPGIYGIDTRALTIKLRSSGAMNGGISTEILDPAELLKQVQAAPSMAGLNLVRKSQRKKSMSGLTPQIHLGVSPRTG
jgi:carbamoylphosphate synthase small subunit